MRRIWIPLLVFSLLIGPLPSYGAFALGQTFTEDFDTTAHMDQQYTTAHWDTSSGLLKLPPTEPIKALSVGTLSAPYVDFPAVYVPDNGRAYLFGGTIDFHVPRSDSIREYDPVRNVLEREMNSRLPIARDSTAAAYATAVGKIYIFGGQDRGSQFRDILEFDPLADTLTTLPQLLPHTLHHSAAVYAPTNNRIYLFGGQGPGGLSASIVEFDVATHSVQVLSERLPTGRRDVSATFVPDTARIYVFGGMGDGGAALDEVLAFDPVTAHLTLLGSRLPLGLAKPASAYIPSAGRVFLVGGERQGFRRSGQIIEFQPSTGSIQPSTNSLPGEGLKGAAAIHAPDSGWLVLFGGDAQLGSWGDEQYWGILRLRWTGSRLRRLDNGLPFETHTSSAVYVPEQNKAYLFGGGRADIVRFDLNTSLAHTMNATLPVPAADPGTLWIPAMDLAYIFDASGGIYTYNPATDVLTTKSQRLPTGFDPRAVAHAPSRNAIYLFDSTDASGLILRYNLADDTLTTLSARLLPAHRATYAVYVPSSDLIFLMGGWNYQASNWADAIWVFDVASETLTRQQDLLMSQPGVYKASVHLPTTNNIYLIGGYGGWSELYAFPFEQIWHFDTTPIRRIVEHELRQPIRLGYQAAVWASAEDRFYTFGGFWKVAPDNMGSSNLIQRLECGHDQQAIGQSGRINSGSAAVMQATLNVNQELHGGTVDYFLSNDGGSTWEAVTPGMAHVFTTQGSNLRWKAVLHGNGYDTPMVDRLTIEWSGEVTNHLPTNGTIAPNSGSSAAGQIVYFTSTHYDPDGYDDIKACRLHAGRDSVPKSLQWNAVFNYQVRSNKIRIRNNNGTRWWGGKAVGSDNVVQNGQAAVHCNLTTVTKTGNVIEIRWAVEFKPSFTGDKKLYLKTTDRSGATTPLQRKGTWTVW